LKSVNDSLLIFESEYEKILGENYSVFKNIISNPVTSDFGTRNSKMKDLVLKRVIENELNKVIFITGNAHLYYSEKRFIPLLSKALPDDYSLTVFAFVYSNCRFYKSNTIYNSRKRFLKYLDAKENKNPLVFFEKKEKQIVPSDRPNIMSIITGLYNQ
jgi:hypothetical protein